MNRMRRIAIWLIAVSGIITTQTVHAGERIVLPSGAFYYQPSATVFGSEATWINPAALARYNTTGFQFMVDYADDEIADRWGTVVSRKGFGVAQRHLQIEGETYNEYVFATGMQLGHQIMLGGSYRYFKDGGGIFENRHSWNIGIINQSGGPWTFSALLSNLNRSRIDGERSQMEMKYGFGYRPTGNKLTFAIDMAMSTGMSINDADFVYFAEYTAKPGLFFNAFIDSDKNFQIGFRTNLLEYFVGAKSGFNEDADHLGTTAFAGGSILRQHSIITKPERRLDIKISGALPENPPRPIFGKKRQDYISLISSVYRAAEDNSVGSILLYLDQPAIGFGRSQELRDAIRYFRARDKEVICHLEHPSNLSYYIATAADKIVIPPVSQLRLVGLRAELSFYAGTLDKLGIKADMVRIGEYKSATEILTREGASEEFKSQLNRVLDEVFRQFVAAIAEGRNLSADSVRTLIDSGPLTSVEAHNAGLVDELHYAERLPDSLELNRRAIRLSAYITDTLTNDNWPRPPVLGVVVAEGEIVEDGFDSPLLGHGKRLTPSAIKRAFAQAGRDGKVKGYVFRIDSPGGMALAADRIYQTVHEKSEKKPVVVSMANIAASGGYNIAVAGSPIFANPATRTGSIGIFGGKADFSGLYEKIALHKEMYTRGKFAGMLSSMRPFSDEERAKYYSMIEAYYKYFTAVVGDSRKIEVDSVDALGRGRIWLGSEALANGLIDRQGGLKQALDYLADKLDLDNYRVEVYPQKRPLFILPTLPIASGILSLFTGSESESGSALSLPFADTDILLSRTEYDLTIE